MIKMTRWIHSREYGQAKKIVDELKDKIDLPRFMAPDSELAGTARAQQLQQEAQSFLAAFFGEPSIQAARPTAPGSHQIDQPAAPVDLPQRATPPQMDSTLLETSSAVADVASAGATPDTRRSNLCSDCGRPLTPGSRFCMHCGARVLS